MLLAVSIALLVAGVIATVMYIKNMARPKSEGIIGEVVYHKVRTDKRPDGPEHKHGKVKFLYDGKEHEATVLLWTGGKTGDRVQLVFPPDAPWKASVYSPGKEILRMALLYGAGLILMAISVWVKGLLNR